MPSPEEETIPAFTRDNIVEVEEKDGKIHYWLKIKLASTVFILPLVHVPEPADLAPAAATGASVRAGVSRGSSGTP